MKIFKWIALSVLLVALFTLGGIFVLAFYNQLHGINDTEILSNGIKTGCIGWLFLNVIKLFSVSGKKPIRSEKI